jgi:hypothetical protein
VWDYSAQLTDQDAVEQAIYTRLKLFQGEWWAALQDGLPLWQSILAQGASLASQSQMEALISARILGSPFVIRLSGVSITFNPTTRAFAYSAQVTTQFSTVSIINYPVAPASQ